MKREMPAGWRDVPIPASVAALPRTASGIPITFTVAWSSETIPEARPDPCLGSRVPDGTMALFHSGSQGEGEPLLHVSEVARVRRAVVTGLCQVCGQRLPGSLFPPWRDGRWLCDLRNHGQTIKLGLRTVPLIVDGWTCEPCLAYALQICPGLTAKDWTPGAEGALRILFVRSAQFVSTYEVVQGLDVAPVVGWVKIAPTDYTPMTPEDFLERWETRAA